MTLVGMDAHTRSRRMSWCCFDRRGYYCVAGAVIVGLEFLELGERRWNVEIAKTGENVLAAGRCIGAPDTIDTFRLICPCFVTGQAAGVAAALSVKNGCTPRTLGYAKLKRELEKQKVYFG